MDKEKIKAKLLANILINPDNNCWEWQGVKNKLTYGKLRLGTKQFRTSRLAAYVYLNFDIHSITNIICHKCNNKCCINPDHLYIGTDYTNQIDSVKAGTHNQAQKTHCPQGHEYTNISRLGKRSCRTCNTLANRKYHNKQKRSQALA